MSAAVTSGLPKGELEHLINALIDNRHIKDILDLLLSDTKMPKTNGIK